MSLNLNKVSYNLNLKKIFKQNRIRNCYNNLSLRRKVKYKRIYIG